jgi:hypothetical protein
MSTLAPKMDERVEAVYFTRDSLVVDLRDGRSISVPLAWYPRLQKATIKQRSSWEICGSCFIFFQSKVLNASNHPHLFISQCFIRLTSRIFLSTNEAFSAFFVQ